MNRKHPAKLGLVVGAVLAALAILAPAAPAATPAPGYEDFAGCPSPDENPNVFACIEAIITGGKFQMGSKDVPIKNPITISGGLEFGSGNFAANSKGGLAPVKQQVPGGLIGLTGLDWLVNFLSVEELKLYATTELAGKPGSPVLNPFFFPIRVHLQNPALGKKCYVGSFANPIKLNLTFGTTSPPAPNKPITGKEPTLVPGSRPGVFTAPGGTLVDNAFAAPGASGCELDLGLIKFGIDGLVNFQSGLPSPAGTNTTVQNVDQEVADPAVVYP